jgi:flagellar basal-body rod protein FlgG
MRALSIAATGMAAQQSNVEVIANNIANVNTTGYKRARAEFSDLLYQTDRLAGVPGAGADNVVPEGLSFGLGVRPVGVRNLHIQGGFTRTGNSLDLALNGQGYFQISGSNGETHYSRAGAFSKNAQGQVVNGDGLPLVPAVTVPANTTEVIVNDAGQIFARVGSSSQLQGIGQITLARFTNDAGLEPLGGNLFKETPASGAPTVVAAGEPGMATIQQGYLENSNVDPVKEITELIAAQRAYEMNSKVIQAADDMYGVIAKGIR